MLPQVQLLKSPHLKIEEEIKKDLTANLKTKGVRAEVLDVKIKRNKVNVSLYLTENSAE